MEAERLGTFVIPVDNIEVAAACKVYANKHGCYDLRQALKEMVERGLVKMIPNEKKGEEGLITKYNDTMELTPAGQEWLKKSD
jgi:hypothetical protein